MRKQKWKWVLISVVCFMLSTLTTMAADERLGTIVDGSLLTDQEEVIGYSERPVMRGTYLESGY